MKDDKDPGTLDIFTPPTPIQRRRIMASADIAECPAKDITFQHTVLCQTALPYRNPGDDVRRWEREQGRVSLEVEAGRARNPATRRYEDVGLPFGSRPRLILAHLNREVLLQGSPSVEVEASLTAFVRRIQNGRSPQGEQIRRFKDQLARLSAATVRLAVDISEYRAFQINAQIIKAFELWSKTPDGQRVLWPSEVHLSQDYFDSLTRHAVPLDERAIGALANSPLALDVYCWLAQRLHRVPKGKPQFIPWTALHEQFGAGYSQIRDFRLKLLRVLDDVHAQYRTARIEADGEGVVLRNSPPPVAARIVPARKLLG